MKARWNELHQALKRYDDLRPVSLPRVLTATDLGPVSPPTLIPGGRKQDVIEPGYLSVLDPLPAQIRPSQTAPQSTGRRLALARWLSRPDNPLSTRVIVNRIWQFHFGRGLVKLQRFRSDGRTSTHPELLDWLTTELVTAGWSLKPLHRLILASATYRQAARRTESDFATGERIDPENRLHWKRTVQRLDAEQIRDAMLAVSGGSSRQSEARVLQSLNRGGRSILEWFATARMRFWKPSMAPTAPLNTTPKHHHHGHPGAALDQRRLDAGAGKSPRRAAAAPTITTLNDQSLVTLAYRLTFGRQPEPEEIGEAQGFLKEQAQPPSNHVPQPNTPIDHAALVDFCHVLLNSNEFLYVD